MQRKAGRIILLVIVAIMVLTAVLYVISRFVENPFVEGNAFDQGAENEAAAENEEDSVEKNEDNQTAKKEIPYPVSKIGYGILPYEKNTKKIGERFVIEDELNRDMYAEFCVNGVQFTKESVDSDAIYKILEDGIQQVQLDEAYNIVNDFNYVVVNLSIRNLAEKELEMYMTSFRYFPYDPATEDVVRDLTFTGKVMGYKTLDIPRTIDKSYARVLIPGGEEFTCNLVYLQKDEEIEGKIPYLHYSHTGMSIPYAEEDRFVRLVQ